MHQTEVKKLLTKATKAWWFVAEVVHFSQEKYQFMWPAILCRLLQQQACTGMASQNDRSYGCLWKRLLARGSNKMPQKTDPLWYGVFLNVFFFNVSHNCLVHFVLASRHLQDSPGRAEWTVSCNCWPLWMFGQGACHAEVQLCGVALINAEFGQSIAEHGLAGIFGGCTYEWQMCINVCKMCVLIVFYVKPPIRLRSCS